MIQTLKKGNIFRISHLEVVSLDGGHAGPKKNTTT